jgi:RNA polymerase sigma factor (sigma-70 family)
MSGPTKARHATLDPATLAWPESPSQRDEARRQRALRRERRHPEREGSAEHGDRWSVWIDNRDMLYRRCLGWTNGNATEAEDLLGQLLMRLVRVESDELLRVKCPRAWMTRILRHLYVDLVRGNWRAQSHDVEIERSLHASAEPDPSAEVWRGELSEALRSAIDALPSSLRGPLVQRYIEGLDYQHIARCHDITPPTARKRCQLARDRIRQSLKTTISQS